MDLTNLTKEQKIELYDALQEKKKRKRLKKDNYKPNAGQEPVHGSTAMIRLLTSGNGSGKTTLCIHEALWQAHGYNPVSKIHNKVPTDVVVLLDQANKADLIWKPELLKWFDIPEKNFKKCGKPYTSVIELSLGSRIFFFSQEAEPTALEGIQGYSLVIADEPPPEWQFNALFRGAREKGIIPKFLLSGTLIGSNSAWLRKLQTRWAAGLESDVECFRTSSYVNEANLAEGFLDKFSARLSPAERAIRIEGLPGDLEGLALAHLFKRKTHLMADEDFKYNTDMPCILAVDPHTSKPHVAVLLTCDKDNHLYAIKEASEKINAEKYTQKYLIPWIKNHRVIDLVVDCSGVADMTSGNGYESFIDEVNRILKKSGIGLRMRATRKMDKADEAFVERIQNALVLPEKEDLFGKRVPKLRILASLKGLISNMENVMWQRDRKLQSNKPKLEIGDKDFLAALKYALSCNLSVGASRGRVIRKQWRGKRK